MSSNKKTSPGVWMSIQEFADKFGVSPTTARRRLAEAESKLVLRDVRRTDRNHGFVIVRKEVRLYFVSSK